MSEPRTAVAKGWKKIYPPPTKIFSEKTKEYIAAHIIRLITVRKKIKSIIFNGEYTLTFFGKYPAKYPVRVIEIPATPNTSIEKESCINPQNIPIKAPSTSPFLNAK